MANFTPRANLRNPRVAHWLDNHPKENGEFCDLRVAESYIYTERES